MRFISTVLILLILGTCQDARAQQTATVSGFVKDASNGETLIGSNVFFKEGYLGGSTNLSGYYVIPKITPGTYTIVSTYIGYQTQSHVITVAPGEKRVLNFSLDPQALEGQEIQIVADSIRTIEKLYRKPISNIELDATQINAVPQIAEADLLRALQTLPGVLPLSDFSTALYVRGGTPDQNLYLIDGTDVYNPEHAFGIFSTFNTDAIKKVELFKGGFGAAYGGRLSAILDVNNLDGNREHFEGSASISLLSAKTTLQMPLGSFGSLSGSIRRTYFDQTVAKAIDEVPDYYFYDGNVKSYLDLDANNKLTLSFYGGRDFLDIIFNEKSSEEIGFEYDWGNKTGSAQWTRIFTPQLFSNFWITASRFSSDFDFGDFIDVRERNFVSDITFKGDLQYHYSEHLIARFGFEQKNLHVKFKQTFPGGLVNVDTRPEHYVGFIQTNWRPNWRWDIESGLRVNYFDSQNEFLNYEPRLSAKYRLSETINLKAATGLYHQYLHRIPRFFITDIWSVSNQYQDESSALHYILGYQQELDGDYQFEVETYYKEYNNIFQFNQTFLTELTAEGFNEDNEPIYTDTDGLFNQGEGYSLGFEIMTRKDLGAITGWLAYSYAETEYEFKGINQGDPFAPRHDRSSTINLVANIDLKNLQRVSRGMPFKKHKGTWTFGINFVYSTGQPFTEPGSAYIVRATPGSPYSSLKFAPTRINNIRFPAYARLDLSLTYERQFSGWSLAPYIQVFNVGNRKNVWFVDYEYNSGLPNADEQYMFPLLPTVGINATF